MEFILQQRRMILEGEVVIIWEVLIKLVKNGIKPFKLLFTIGVAVIQSWAHLIVRFLKFNQVGIVSDFKKC